MQEGLSLKMLLDNVKNYINERYNAESVLSAEDYIVNHPKRNRKLIDFDYGFVSYEMRGDACIIYDIYVAPSFRKKGVTTKVAHVLNDLAKEAGKKVLIGFSEKTGQNKELGINAIKANGGIKIQDLSTREVYIKGVE